MWHWACEGKTSWNHQHISGASCQHAKTNCWVSSNVLNLTLASISSRQLHSQEKCTYLTFLFNQTDTLEYFLTPTPLQLFWKIYLRVDLWYISKLERLPCILIISHIFMFLFIIYRLAARQARTHTLRSMSRQHKQAEHTHPLHPYERKQAIWRFYFFPYIKYLWKKTLFVLCLIPCLDLASLCRPHHSPTAQYCSILSEISFIISTGVVLNIYNI